MTYQFHNMSIEDREMFEYNRRHNELQRILAQPENRIKYCFEFLDMYVRDHDEQMKLKCYQGIAHYSEQLDYSESHY